MEGVKATAILNGRDFLRAWINIASGKGIHDKQRELLALLRRDLADHMVFVDRFE